VSGAHSLRICQTRHNIDSLVSAYRQSQNSRMTITAKGDVETLEMIIKNVENSLMAACSEHTASAWRKNWRCFKVKNSPASRHLS